MKKNKTLSNRKTRTTMLKSIFAVLGVVTISASVASLVTSCSCSNQEWVVRGIFRFDKKTGRTLLGFKPDITTEEIEKAFPNHIMVLPNDFDNIDKYAFCNQTTGQTTIPNWITGLDFGANSSCQLIDNNAFKNAPFGGEIHFPKSVTAIGISAFENNTKVTKLYFPDSIVTVGQGAFKNCTGLNDLDFTEWKKVPEGWADASDIFTGCLKNLGYFKLNQSVENYSTFCAQWKAFFTTRYHFVFGPDKNQYWKIQPDDPESDIFNISYEYDEQTKKLVVTLHGFATDFDPSSPEGSAKLHNYMKSITGDDHTFKIPPQITKIVDNAFPNTFGKSNDYKTLIINETCETIGNKAFGDLQFIETIKFSSDSVQLIGEDAFNNCVKVLDIYVDKYKALPAWGNHRIFAGLIKEPSKVRTGFGGQVFVYSTTIAEEWKDQMKDVWTDDLIWQKGDWHTVPDSSTVLDIDSTGMIVRGWKEGVTEDDIKAEFGHILSIPESVQFIQNDAFIDRNKYKETGDIVSTIPNFLDTLEFHNLGLAPTISSLKTIGSRAFMYSPFKSVEIPKNINLHRIDNFAFYGSKVENADLPEIQGRIQTLEIGISAFANTPLKNDNGYIIPDYVSKIENQAFYYTGLTNVIFKTKPKDSATDGKLELVGPAAFGFNSNLTKIDLSTWAVTPPSFASTYFSHIFGQCSETGEISLPTGYNAKAWDLWLFNNGITVEEKYWQIKK